MATIGNLTVDLRANTAKFMQGMNKASAKTKQLRKDVEKTTGTLKGMAGVVLGLAGAGGFTALINSQRQYIDSLAKMSDKLGLTTTEITRLQHAVAQTADMTDKQFNIALQRMVRRLEDAAKKGGPVEDQLNQIGLSAVELNRLSPHDSFLKIADAMKETSDQGLKVKTAFSLFDTEGVNLVNTLQKGSEVITQLGDDAERLGITISRFDAAKVEAMNDGFDRSGKIIRGLGNYITVSLAPSLITLTEYFTNAAIRSNDLGNNSIEWTRVFVRSIGIVLDAMKAFEISWAVVKLASVQSIGLILRWLDNFNQALVKLANLIPGININPITALTEIVRSLENVAFDTNVEMFKLLNEQLPSAKLMQGLDDVKLRLTEIGNEAVKNQEKFKGGTTKVPFAPGYQEFKVPDDAFKGTEDKLSTHLDRTHELWTEWRSMELKSMEEFEKTKFDTSKKWSELSSIQQVGAFETAFHGLSRLAASQEGEQSERYKQLARVAVIANTAGAIMRAYMDLGPVGGSIAAVGLASLGKVQYDAIDSGGVSSSGGSLGGGSIGIGTQTTGIVLNGVRTEGQTAAAGAQQVQVNFNINAIDTQTGTEFIQKNKSSFVRMMQDSNRQAALG